MSDHTLDHPDPNQGRYVLILGALGNPTSIQETSLIETLAAWLGDQDVQSLTSMVARQLDQASHKHLTILCEIDAVIGDCAEPILNGGRAIASYHLDLSASLVAWIAAAAK